MSDEIHKRGRPPLVRDSAAVYAPPKATAERGGFSIATLYRGVAQGIITPPSYPTPKTPIFHLPTFDRDMERARAMPSEHEGGCRADRLTEARQQARAKRENEKT